jgi:hypothetical protein
MAEPPLLDGADQVTVAVVAAMDVDTDWGAFGTVTGTTGEADAVGDDPTELMAATVKVYETPYDNSVFVYVYVFSSTL